MKRIVLGSLAVVVVLAAIGYSQRTKIALGVMERVVAANFGSNLMDELPDGLHAALCGAGSPLPDPNRSGPCTAVIAGDRLFVVDSGSGSSRILSRMRIPQGSIEAILLTHFHSDHIDGLGALLLQRWANGGHDQPVPIYGPTGVGAIVDGFNLAYGPSQQSRILHHGEAVVPRSGAGGVARPFATPVGDAGVVVLDSGGVKITAFLVDHAPVEPAVGYRFDYRNRSLVISGDTVKSANVQKFAQGVDLLIHEALSPDLVGLLARGAEDANRPRLTDILHDIQDYHASPTDAAEIARDAEVGYLLYNHIVPPLLLAPMVDAFLEGVDDIYRGPFSVGSDGTLVRMEAGSGQIEVESALF